MFLIKNVDGLMLMAVTLASKRHAATLSEVISATELIHGFIPSEHKLGDALVHLHAQGLVTCADQQFALTPAGEEIMAGHPKKADTAARLRLIEERLVEHSDKVIGETGSPLTLSDGQVNAAMREHRQRRAAPGPRLLTPKPKGVEVDYTPKQKWRPGRKPATAGKSGKNFK